MTESQESIVEKLKLLDRRDVAEMLGCSIRQVDFFRAEKGLPFFKLGALVKFDADSIRFWLKNQKVEK